MLVSAGGPDRAAIRERLMTAYNAGEPPEVVAIFDATDHELIQRIHASNYTEPDLDLIKDDREARLRKVADLGADFSMHHMLNRTTPQYPLVHLFRDIYMLIGEKTDAVDTNEPHVRAACARVLIERVDYRRAAHDELDAIRIEHPDWIIFPDAISVPQTAPLAAA
jgi:hypothetical protein